MQMVLVLNENGMMGEPEIYMSEQFLFLGQFLLFLDTLFLVHYLIFDG